MHACMQIASQRLEVASARILELEQENARLEVVQVKDSKLVQDL